MPREPEVPEETIDLSEAFVAPPNLEMILEAARRAQDQIDASHARLDDKAKHMLTLTTALMGLVVTLGAALPVPLGSPVAQGFSAAAGGLFLSAVAFLLLSYTPRRSYYDVAPAALREVVRMQTGLAATSYALIASTVDSAVGSKSAVARKARRVEQGMACLFGGLVMLGIHLMLLGFATFLSWSVL